MSNPIRGLILAAAGLAVLLAAAATLRAQGSVLMVALVTTSVPVAIGEETSGSASIISDKALSEIPGLRMTVANLQLEKLAPGTTPETALGDMSIDVGDGSRLPATVPFSWTPRPNETTSTLRLFYKDPDPILTATLPISRQPAVAPNDTDSGVISMPPVASAGGVQVVHGPTSGNSTVMKVEIDGQAAPILAARPGTFFWRVPASLPAGAHVVNIVPGRDKPAVTLPMYTLGLQMSADRTDLLRGMSTKMHVTVTGLDKLPASAWQSDAPPADLVDISKVIASVPGFTPPRPNDPGMVLLVIENRSPSIIRMGNKGDRIVLQLHQKDFAKGPYTYEDKLQSIQSGAFNIQGIVTAFLKQVSVRPAK